MYLKFDRAGDVAANDRGHLLIIASRAMRQILIDYSRQRKSQKRGGDLPNVTLGPEAERDTLVEQQGERLLDIDMALKRLVAQDERLGKVVESRLFGGLTHDKIADALEIGRSTVTRDWQFAKASIAYTTDSGDHPHWKLYNKPSPLCESVLLRARAIRYGYRESDEASFTLDTIGS